LNAQELHLKIVAATKSAFTQVRARYPNAEFCGYALYSDPDAITICPAANTCSHLEKMIFQDPSDAKYYRWSPGEWDHEFEGSEHFSEISKHLYDEAKKITSPHEHKLFKQKIYECCVDALESIKEEGFLMTLVNLGF